MKIFTNKKNLQKIIIAIVIVLSFNFIIPNYSQAGFGGVLMGPIIDFIAGLGDAVLSALQFFMYDGNISVGSTVGGAAAGALTIVNPFDSFLLMRSASNFDEKLEGYDMNVTDEELEENGGSYDIEVNADEFDKGWLGWLGIDKDFGVPIIKYTPEKIFSNKVPSLDVNFINPQQWNNQAMDDKSVTQALHSTIANWYIALRNLAIVALLSVLLYVGIRMVISSTVSDKAKYKQMLMDWVIALCIVFFLHYIMSFILSMTQIITEGIDSGTEVIVQINDTTTGKGNFMFKTDLTGLCRLQIQYSDLGARMIYLIFYLALVIYTVMFTWTYVKRAILMAFLTLMAPLVAITYPIDKISDGKAQAYGIWLKEFIFNSLLQPFHLIIYTIFLGAASEIATKNPIYAILFLAFIIPSEKLLRKMFGFEKSSTAGAMSTAAGILGGAAVMRSANNLIGKVGGKSKGSSGKAGVRTKNNAITDSSAPSKVKDMASTFGSNGAQSTISGQENTARPIKQNASETPTGANSTIGDGYSQTQSGLWVPSSASSANGATNNGTTGSEQRLSQQTQARNRSMQYAQEGQQQTAFQQAQAINRSIRDNFAFRKDANGNLNDSRGLGQWLGEGIGQTVKDGKNAIGQKFGNNRFVRGVSGKASRVKDLAGKAKSAYNSNNPFANTIRGAVGTAGKAAVGTAKFAGKAAVGATFGLAAGIAGDDLEDVAKFGLAGATLGVAGLPVLGRGITNAASDMRNTYETEAFGAEGAALREQTREKMKDDEYRDSMNELYQDMYGKEPTISESRQIAKEGIDYYNAGITDTKEIRKSVKFEKELRDRMMADGVNADDATERAKKQAMVISNMASKIDEKELINESKRNDRRNQIFKQLKDTGMEEKAAASGADYTIQLLMKRKGLSPE